METGTSKKGYYRIKLNAFIRVMAGVLLFGVLAVLFGLFISYPDVTFIPVLLTGLLGLGLWFVLSKNPEMIYWTFAATSAIGLIYQLIIKITYAAAGTISLTLFIPLAVSLFSIFSMYRNWPSKITKIVSGIFFVYEVYRLIQTLSVVGFLSAFSSMSLPHYIFNAVVMLIMFFAVYEEIREDEVSERRKSCLKKIGAIAVITGICLVALAIFADHGTETHTYEQIYKDGTAKVLFGVDWWMSREVTYEVGKIGETLIPGIVLAVVGAVILIIAPNLKFKVKPLSDEKNSQAVKQQIKINKKALTVAGSVVGVIIVALLLITQIVVPSSKYKTALSAYDAGNYEEAFEQFSGISYKDSSSKAQEALSKYQFQAFPTSICVGDKILWGSYEQDNKTSNGKEQIAWVVLSVENNQATLISEEALECKPLNDEDAAVSWGESSLAAWANSDFLQEAFAEEQRDVLNNTSGLYVSILTKNQAETLIVNNIDLTCVATEYTYAHGESAFLDMLRDENGNCTWWIDGGRSYSSGKSIYKAYTISTSGNVTQTIVTHKAVGFRPIITISLENFGLNVEDDSAFEPIDGEVTESAEVTEESVARNEPEENDQSIPEIGSIIEFGSYEQDNNIENGKEVIEWIVLDQRDDQILIISKYALDCQMYNTIDTAVTWETSSLRTWLNETFLDSAFTNEEASKIVTTTVAADKNSTKTDAGNDTQDKVFLLGIAEAEKYFNTDSSRKCLPTDYAIANKAFLSSSGYCWWWLRSTGTVQNGAVPVHHEGDISNNSSSVDSEYICVRPTMWITLNGESQATADASAMQERFENFKNSTSYFAEHLNEYPIVSGDDLETLIVGSWDTVYAKADSSIQIYNSDGTRKQEGSSTANYYWKVDGDWLLISQKEDFSTIFDYMQIRDVGGGYYIVNTAMVSKDRMNSEPSEMMIKLQ